MRKQRVEHGMSKHPLYSRWQDMVRRCHVPSDSRYPWYGAKGVTVCNEWREDPVAYINWCLAQGWKPGMQVDKDIKVPGSKLYSPDTCLVVTRRANMIAVVGRSSGRITCKLKITTAQADEIIRRKQSGEKTRYLASEYGVSISTINRIYRAA